MTKKKTSLLTPLQVKEAIIMWARHNRLIGTYEEVGHTAVEIRKNGSAAIKQVKS